MKKLPPSDEDMVAFTKLKYAFVGLVVLAVIIWKCQYFAASFAATELRTSTTLRTTQEVDDARVTRAFNEAKRNSRFKITFEKEKNPQQQTRDAILTITGASERGIFEERQALVTAMQAAFANEGPGELFDVGNSPKAYPVPNHAYEMVRQSCHWVALGILILALAMLATQWKRSGLPQGALFGILATGLSAVLFMMEEEGMGIWKILILLGPPLALLGLVFVIMRKVRRAAAWVQGSARIVTSKIEVARHRHAGDTTNIRNLPFVEYEFDVGGRTMRGDRISLGAAPADNVDEVLKRYSRGASVPVFYDPANPEDCVLERDPPASPGCIWGGGIFLVVVYELVVLGFWNVISINKAFDAVFPNIHHPLVVITAGLLGLFCLAAGVWNALHPREIAPWVRTQGRIVSSVIESFEESDSTSSGHRVRTYYQPVIEFSYQVGGQEYHGSSGSASIVTSGSKAWADEEAARYTAGMEVVVFYDPKVPTQSSLTDHPAMTINGRKSLLVGAILVAAAIYAALH